ncbi:hypothetical protein [Amycolatopsis regifaucium]|uniref:PPE family domain-containing protein n=1 Tax=Amycolatopsis regifaucium TaxID=546365 RepID=A0A154MB17_9PSEU|nr:hypothetical protein [Amycolatopsis regifaucium]KZB81477.1 hypothetical protein AVL48_05560 [Amycolatopsis regifaucium]OKA04740.1 hypothetical protein ATP06_0230575 [Amycolatopsis regifaucium]SFH30356.1 hypothetical protein SAMN04489731_103436 [Amycolatopsis regifaucium]
MAVPYNLLPIEMHMAMITAEQANVPVLTDAAKMWTEVRAWIESARAELHTRAGELAPDWQDEGGREHEEKVQRTLAELKFWGDRIDAAQPAETLTTLAAAIPEALQVVTGFYESYLTALSSPLTAWAAPGFQQLAGTRMTALGGQFDMSMLKVVAASGIQSPGDLMPTAVTAAEGNSPADFINAAKAGMEALTEVQGLAESVGVGGGGTGGEVSLPEVPGQTGTSGVSLAGLTAVPAAVSPMPSPGGITPGTGTPPVPTGGLGGFGVASGLAGIPAAKPAAGKRAPSLASEIQPGTASPSTAKAASSPMSPMMPPHGGGQNTAGTLRPGSSEQPTGRSGASRRQASGGSDGVPAKLRGRAANGNPDAGFTLARGRQSGETESGSVQMLDEDLWRPNSR